MPCKSTCAQVHRCGVVRMCTGAPVWCCARACMCVCVRACVGACVCVCADIVTHSQARVCTCTHNPHAQSHACNCTMCACVSYMYTKARLNEGNLCTQVHWQQHAHTSARAHLAHNHTRAHPRSYTRMLARVHTGNGSGPDAVTHQITQFTRRPVI